MAKLPKYFYFRITPVINKGALTQIMVEDASDTDVVEVVRCKDCKFYTPYEVDSTEGMCKKTNLVCYDDYCSSAERKDN